ncbi:mechanosensitive channel MscK [Thauera aromatica]|uniref:Potassium efflux system KefA-like protein n=1 Tax=Thauera aromatica K172 TaxID=44139 RepID=A0A2R4BI88_THAAR|nr:mechanosensitive channel MscK [Thauera aromatica]AVR86982.1 Potassium efflux system KefA-like protein [Thauera aromatica K172]
MPLLRLLVLLLLPLLPLQAAAQAPVPPAAAEVRARLDTLAERKLAEAEHRSAQQALEQALEQLTAAADYRQQLAALKEKLGSALPRTADARRQLATLQAGNGHLPEFAADTSPAQLEERLAERNTALAGWQRRLDEANTLLVDSRTGPERAQTEISANQARMAAIEAALKSGREPGRDSRPLGNERRDALAAEWHALDAQTALRREELAGNSLLQDLGQARHDLASLQVQRLGQQIQVLQAAINARRSANAVEAVETLEAAAGEGRHAGTGGLLAREAAANQQLSDYLLRTTEHLNTLTQRNLATRQQLDSLNRNRSLIDEQIEVLQGSLLLSRILLEQKRALPQPAVDARLTEQIADIRLYQFEINKQREQLAQPAAYAERLLAQAPAEEADSALREPLGALLAARAELLERLNRELSALLNESITLQLNERQLQSTTDNLRTTLDEQMFWIPSNHPLDFGWLQALPGALQAQLGAIPWQSASTELWTGLQARPFLFLPVLLLTLILLWRRRWLRARLDGVHADIGYVRRDSQLHTPLAILYNVLLALPVSLLLALTGLALQMDARGQNASLGAALVQMAEAWLVFYTAYRVLEPGGVAERHFHVDRALTHELYLHMRRLGLVVLAVVAIVTIAEHQPEGLADDVLGLLTLLAGYASMAWLMGRLLVHKSSATRPSPLRAALALALALMPLALIGALLTGYYYTALKLTGRLIDTLFVLIAWRLLGAMFRRALEVAARRLVYQRAVERREAAEREGRIGAEGDDSADSPSLDVDKINQQSLRLLRLGLLGGLLGALYWVWADLITVFAYLDNIVLYQFTAADGSSGTPISLRDVLGALLIAGIAFILAANLPGLLEVLVLSRMKLAQGSAYAATTLLSYVIAGVGIVATFGTLGVSWDKLQWLVAALSVGLGFGLQEIFANFVSGLIILFERPVRIGDVVTIGNVSGTVSRIQIRATTITDFDRKEIIVPNKAFITGQLINWSLTDTVTRVTVKVGVAYGADLELTRRLLLQIARDNPRVLDEPAPLAFFLAFGASTLDHELRIHVRELADRNAAIDEINRAIDHLFREHGIEIAFNQMDVHIRSVADGREAKLQTLQAQAGEGGGSGQ